MLALPTLVGYAFPLGLSFLATVAMKLCIAGCGTYFFLRLCGARPVAAAFSGATFMLSGAFSGWLGWSISGPLAWAGFLAAGVVLTYRFAPRVREVVFLALAVAFAIYGGFPETDVLLIGGLGVMVLVTGAIRQLVARDVAWRGVARIGLGLLGGATLSSPLWLPGLTVLKASARNGKNAAGGLPLHTIFLAFAQGFDGLPIKGSAYFGSVNYFETAAYVGVLAIVLAGVALICSWRRPVVAGCAVAVLFCLGVIYDLGAGAPIQHLVSHLGLGAVALGRMLSVLAFLVAVLAGLGLERVARGLDDRDVRLALLAMSALVCLVLFVMWAKVGSAAFLPAGEAPPKGITAASLRQDGLYWPTAEAAALAVVAAALFFVRDASRLRVALTRYLAPALCGAQASFLLFAGVGINSYAHVVYPVTPQVATLQRIVGDTLVGLDGPNARCKVNGPQPCGVRQWTGLGFYPNINLAYQVRELALHDPAMPADYFTSWPVGNSDRIYPGNLNLFVPAITSIALAQRYGVSYVLVTPGVAGPPGMRLVTYLSTPPGKVGLYAVPGAHRFSFSGTGAQVVSVSHPGDASWHLDVRVARASRLTIRVTDVAGMHLSANGTPLATTPIDGIFLQATVPAGTTSVVVSYWPRRLTVGLALALLTVIAFVAWALYGRYLLAFLRNRRH